MKLPSVYPLTSPSSHSTSKITAIVNSISCLLDPFARARCVPAFVRRALRTSHRISSMKHLRLSAVAGLLILLSPPAAPFAQMDTSLFAGLKWRSIGPARGGRSQAGAGSVARPLEYYFGATGGGLWKTTDGGLTWKPLSDRSFKSSSVGAVAIAASNPDVVYVGMGETELRGNIIQGDGVYKTTDGGKTWTSIG